MVSSSCSTTSTVLPRSRNSSSAASSRPLSRWCSPMEGSSSTYSTPRSFDPICVASRMRWPSPPESVAAERSSEIYPNPTAFRNCKRSTISCTMRPAMLLLRARSTVIFCAASSARETGSAVKSAMDMPFTFTARLSGRSRLPWHAGHSRSRHVIQQPIAVAFGTGLLHASLQIPTMPRNPVLPPCRALTIEQQVLCLLRKLFEWSAADRCHAPPRRSGADESDSATPSPAPARLPAAASTSR